LSLPDTEGIVGEKANFQGGRKCMEAFSEEILNGGRDI
jgi:hypothetical protein